MNTWLLPVAERVALAQAGAPSSVWSGSSVTYALGPAALVVVIEAGDRPDGSAVHAADEVVLRPPFPDEVVAALTAMAGRLPIHGFVRVPEGCLPLGGVRIMLHRSSRAPGASQPRFEDCRLTEASMVAVRWLLSAPLGLRPSCDDARSPGAIMPASRLDQTGEAEVSVSDTHRSVTPSGRAGRPLALAPNRGVKLRG